MPMVLQTDSDVKDDLDKDQINAPVTMMTTATNNTDDNGGSGSGSAGSVNTIAEEESNENAILPSHEDEDVCVGLPRRRRMLNCRQLCYPSQRKRKRLFKDAVQLRSVWGI